MNYTLQEVLQFAKTVCVNCKCQATCVQMQLDKKACPKIFNWKLYHTEDGSCPLTSEFINNLK